MSFRKYSERESEGVGLAHHVFDTNFDQETDLTGRCLVGLWVRGLGSLVLLMYADGGSEKTV
jgi:hypothetical protein